MRVSADLSQVLRRARGGYVKRVADGGAEVPWWTAVVVTAASQQQADRYANEIGRRREQGTLPPGVSYLVVADPEDERIGSGGATFNALRALAEASLPSSSAASLVEWWQTQRVLVMHAGGDSRRLPQYSFSGKLFTALPVKTPWGQVSTVFDEFLALSTLWAARLPYGLVVGSGDVVLTFDADALRWDRPGVSGVAIRQPIEVGSQHGVYVADGEGRVYSYLQKPSAAEVRAAGGMLEGDQVALDSGLMRFDASMAARMTELAGVRRQEGGWTVGEGILRHTAAGLPVIDLYQHIALALTGAWAPPPDADPLWHEVAEAFGGCPFWCDLVEGDFVHVGTTALLRKLMTEETDFSRLYDAQQRLGAVAPTGVRCAGVIVDSVLQEGSELGPGSVVIECHLEVPVQAGRGAILHGVTAFTTPVRVPEDTVVHEVPIALPDGRRGVVIRVYGVADDAKALVAGGRATWFGRPILETLAAFGLDPEQVWPDTPAETRTLWNASLYPLSDLEEVRRCALWMMGVPEGFTANQWRRLERLSMAASAKWPDKERLASCQALRSQARWRLSALELAEAGGDVRPLLAHPPSISALAAVGRALSLGAEQVAAATPTEAASRYYRAGLFHAQAGLADEAEQARAAAFRCVQRAVVEGVPAGPSAPASGAWRHEAVSVSAPARVDFGGGWSDTPPFCLDWGGTVLNMAIALEGEYPIRASVRRLEEPILRCVAGENEEAAVEWRSAEELMRPPEPGSPFTVPRVAMQILGIVPESLPGQGGSLAKALAARGGGLEIRTAVRLPMGSGLGTSSILGAAILRALAEMMGSRPSEAALVDQVSCLEQLMTTGGGWQDQAGGVFPGAKLVTSGPGLRQRLRVQPVRWSRERAQEFKDRFLLYYTGIIRIAKDLLMEVVGRYLAREVAAVQVLHSIKTLAVEMAYAMGEGEWDYLGQLMDRHWQLNQVLDPHTTNAPINALLQQIRPYLAGAKLAGAGGGGYMMLLAKDPQASRELRERLSARDGPGRLCEYEIANDGLGVTTTD